MTDSSTPSSPRDADTTSQGYGPGYTAGSPAQPSAPTTEGGTDKKAHAVRWMFRAAMALAGIILLGALVLAVLMEAGSGKEWAGVGVLVAVAVAVPTIICLGLAWAGTKVRRRSPNAGVALSVLGLGGLCLIFLNACAAGLGGF